MSDDPALQEAQIQLQAAFAKWRARLRQVAGPQATDEFALEMLAFLAQAHLDMEAQHAAAAKAHVRAEKLPTNVVSLEQKRAKAAGWSKTEALGTMPAGSVSVGDIVTPEIVNRLITKTGLDANALTAEAIRRGFASLVAEKLEPETGGA